MHYCTNCSEIGVGGGGQGNIEHPLYVRLTSWGKFGLDLLRKIGSSPSVPSNDNDMRSCIVNGQQKKIKILHINKKTFQG